MSALQPAEILPDDVLDAVRQGERLFHVVAELPDEVQLAILDARQLRPRASASRADLRAFIEQHRRRLVDLVRRDSTLLRTVILDWHAAALELQLDEPDAFSHEAPADWRRLLRELIDGAALNGSRPPAALRSEVLARIADKQDVPRPRPRAWAEWFVAMLCAKRIRTLGTTYAGEVIRRIAGAKPGDGVNVGLEAGVAAVAGAVLEAQGETARSLIAVLGLMADDGIDIPTEVAALEALAEHGFSSDLAAFAGATRALDGLLVRIDARLAELSRTEPERRADRASQLPARLPALPEKDRTLLVGDAAKLSAWLATKDRGDPTVVAPVLLAVDAALQHEVGSEARQRALAVLGEELTHRGYLAIESMVLGSDAHAREKPPAIDAPIPAPPAPPEPPGFDTVPSSSASNEPPRLEPAGASSATADGPSPERVSVAEGSIEPAPLVEPATAAAASPASPPAEQTASDSSPVFPMGPEADPPSAGVMPQDPELPSPVELERNAAPSQVASPPAPPALGPPPTPTSESRGASSLAMQPTRTPPPSLPRIEAVPFATSSARASSIPPPAHVERGLPEVAREARAQGNDPASLVPVLWAALQAGRVSLAYRLASVVPENVAPPPLVFRAIAIAAELKTDFGKLAERLREDLAQLPDALSGMEPHRAPLLVMAAALRAALVAPTTDAPSMLRGLRFPASQAALYRLAQAAADGGERLSRVAPGMLQRFRDNAAWIAKAREQRAELRAWWEQAENRTISFQAGTQLWKSLLAPGKLVHSLVHAAREDRGHERERVQKELRRLGTDAAIDVEIQRAERELKRTGQRITGNAVQQIRRAIREAMGHAEAWADLEAVRPAGSDALRPIEQLERELSDAIAAATAELDKLPADSIERTAAAAAVRRSINGIGSLFDAGRRSPPEEAPLRTILNEELLRAAPLDLDDEWEPAAADVSVVRAALLDLAESSASWEEVFAKRAERKDHTGTAQILEHLEASGESEALVGALRAKRTTHIVACQKALERDVEETRTRVESAVTEGVVQVAERSRWIATLHAITQNLGSTTRFSTAHATLAEIRREISARKIGQADEVRARLRIFGLPTDTAAAARVEGLLAAGEIASAHEYVDLIARGEELPPVVNPTPAFAAFFPIVFRQLAESLPKLQPIDLIGRARRGERIGPLDFGSLEAEARSGAVELLRAWFETKRARSINELDMKTILMGLGFRGVEIKRASGSGWNVHTHPLSSADQCPVSRFGSDAKGSYRVFEMFDQPTEGDLLARTGDGGPTLVLYFGVMSEQRRRALAHACRARAKSVLVVDDALLARLAAEAGGRLGLLFRLTLPFTFVEPYSATAGVPPEMFFGRERERSAIVDPGGTSFLYGGRQLGKTALLRDIVRRHHSVADGRLVLYFDLKNESFGYSRPLDDFWVVLAKRMADTGTTRGLPSHTGADKVLEHIKTWLDAEPRRTVLLLLDEADRFLEVDANDRFARSSRLKGLMEDSSRRFKVVFAGLHNVQRTTQQANHPLAHLGSPICIGPLLENGEWREARALIEQPLASIGYTFETPDLVTRVLSQTNYYPSLIQLYGQHLLRHVNSPQRPFDVRSTPPFVLTSAHVDEAYRLSAASILDRFKLTLQLDRRYEVIAYAMAWTAGNESGRGLVEGFGVEQVRTLALDFWSEGFKSSATLQDLRVLLEEMVGLGVLRATSDARYALRSPNIVQLLGSPAEIEDVLERSREPPVEYDASSFRAANVEDREETWKRSPFTAQQEADLLRREHGVAVIVGVEAAGLRDVQQFLRSGSGVEAFTAIRGHASQSDLLGEIDRAAARVSQGLSLVFVGPDCSWTGNWIRAAEEKVKGRLSRTAFSRVIFAGDAQRAWDTRDDLDAITATGGRVISLRPWHDAALRQWLEDLALGASEQAILDRIRKATGMWPELIEEVFRRANRPGSRLDLALASLEQDLAVKGFLRSSVFGLDVAEPSRVLSALVQLGEVGMNDVSTLATLIEGTDARSVERAIAWAERLFLVEPVDQSWRVDPVAARVLAS